MRITLCLGSKKSRSKAYTIYHIGRCRGADGAHALGVQAVRLCSVELEGADVDVPLPVMCCCTALYVSSLLSRRGLASG